MVTLIESCSIIQSAGNKPKMIEEYVGRVSSNTGRVSIARMKSPGGWEEPGQTPRFDEYTVVLKGLLLVETKNGSYEVRAGQAVVAHRGEWVRYSTPNPEGAEYIACAYPRFHRRPCTGTMPMTADSFPGKRRETRG